MRGKASGGALVYDRDCRFCRASAAWMRRRLPEEVDVRGAEGLEAVQWVATDGVTFTGAAAISRALEASPRRGWRWLGRALRSAPVRPVARVAYALIARNRGRLGRYV